MNEPRSTPGDWTGTGDAESALRTLIAMALREDVGAGDWTTLWTVPGELRATATVRAKAPLVVSGTDAATRVFSAVDPTLQVEVVAGDGVACGPGDPVLRVSGSVRSILTAERTALNFLGRLSGIATLTRRFVDAMAGTGATVVDTRKTTPGWRHLEKAAVRAGGGENHRMGLHDMVLVKDNHVAAAGGVTAALEAVASRNRAALPVELEVRTLDELQEALHAKPRPARILLDNMTVATMEEAVRLVGALPSPRPLLEASGNLDLERVPAVARTGVDLLSVGALTHSAPVADLSLLLESGWAPR
jgi:nicotinate-nucleotide pyrophosphorylase (carboxylating)